MLNQRFSWTRLSLEDAWKSWLTSPQLAHIKALPLIHIWGVWIAQNKAILQDKTSSLEATTKQVLEILSFFPPTKDAPSVRAVIEEHIDPSMT